MRDLFDPTTYASQHVNLAKLRITSDGTDDPLLVDLSGGQTNPVVQITADGKMRLDRGLEVVGEQAASDVRLKVLYDRSTGQVNSLIQTAELVNGSYIGRWQVEPDGKSSQKTAGITITSPDTTGVIDTPVGTITLSGFAIAAGARSPEFTIQNASAASVDMLLTHVEYPATGAGTPILFLSGHSSGSFKFFFDNVGAAAINSDIVINYQVIGRI